jgi:hypothetical protein
MVYSSEVVLPADLAFGALRLMFKDLVEGEATRLEEIDTLEEWLNTIIQSTRISSLDDVTI